MKPLACLWPILGCAIICGCGTTTPIPAASQQAACDQIEKLGGKVEISPTGMVLAARFTRTNATDGDLACLGSLAQLRELDLYHTQVTDAGLVHLRGLIQLRGLDLQHTHITDGGLANLERLTQLQDLDLVDTGVSDAGLGHLAGLSQLQWLYLRGSKVTAQGVAKLQKSLPDCKITYGEGAARSEGGPGAHDEGESGEPAPEHQHGSSR